MADERRENQGGGQQGGGQSQQGGGQGQQGDNKGAKTLRAVNRATTRRLVDGKAADNKVGKAAANKAAANLVAAREENSPSINCGSTVVVSSMNSSQTFISAHPLASVLKVANNTNGVFGDDRRSRKNGN